MALVAGTIVPKAGHERGVIVGHERHYMGGPESEYFHETYYMAETGWFNKGHANERLFEGSGFTMGREWVPGYLWGWAPLLVAFFLLGLIVLPFGYKASLVQLFRKGWTWILFGAVWTASQLWMARGAVCLLSQAYGETMAGCGLLLFLGLNGAILLHAMDGRRLPSSASFFWYSLRGWSQSYLVYLIVIALLLWHQGKWPFLGLPLAFGGTLLLWIYTDLRIRRLRLKVSAAL